MVFWIILLAYRTQVRVYLKFYLLKIRFIIMVTSLDNKVSTGKLFYRHIHIDDYVRYVCIQ